MSSTLEIPKVVQCVLPWSGTFFYPAYRHFVPAEYFIAGKSGIVGINQFLRTRIATTKAFDSYQQPVFGLRVDVPGLNCSEIGGSLWSVSLADLWWAITDTEFRPHMVRGIGTLVLVRNGLEDFVVRVESCLRGIELTGLRLDDPSPVYDGTYILGAGIEF